jgi:hypothetical protein
MDRGHWALLPAHFSEKISVRFHDHILTGICGRCRRFRLPQSTLLHKRRATPAFARLDAK